MAEGRNGRAGTKRDRRARSRRARLETSAGGVVYRRESAGATPRFLVIRDPYGHWGLPKGHVETDETPAEAAVREVAEETAVDAVQLETELPRIDWYFHAHGHLIHKFCHFFLMLADADAGEARPREEEGISACVWLPFDQALDRISYENTRAVLREAGARLGLVARD